MYKIEYKILNMKQYTIFTYKTQTTGSATAEEHAD